MTDPGLSASEFTTAFARHGRTLWVLAAAWVGRENAMDLVQETATVAWQRRDRFTPGTDLRAWLSQIARHLGANERRRKRPHVLPHDELDATPARAAAPATELSELDCDDELLHGLRQLPAEQRASLLLHVVSGHTFAEIGAMLDIPENTAASHARRARLSLAGQLATTHHAERHR